MASRARISSLRIAVLVAVASLAATSAPGAETDPDAETRALMAEIFEAMQLLLPLSLEPEAFEDPARRDEVRQALALLERSASRLSEHGESRKPGFAHLAHALAIDARDVQARYAAGYPREARHLVQMLAETCVACHSRLPAASDAPRSEGFLRQARVEELALEYRAKLAYATRQFEDALELYEKLLASPPPPASQLDHEGYLDDYLELSIRVHRDLARPDRGLARFAARQDLDPTLRRQVEAWRRSLARLGPVAARRGAVADARRLVDGASGAADPRDFLVDYLLASAILHARLEGDVPRSERARAYYLLGLIDARIGRTFWLSQAEAFLETAIRLAPGEPVAREAYAVLSDSLVAGYGSDDSELPPDLQVRLDELRRIADGDGAAAGPP